MTRIHTIFILLKAVFQSSELVVESLGNKFVDTNKCDKYCECVYKKDCSLVGKLHFFQLLDMGAYDIRKCVFAIVVG